MKDWAAIDSGEWAPYFQTMCATIARNLEHPIVRAAGEPGRGWSSSPLFAASAISEYFRASIPYVFLPVRDVWGNVRVWSLFEVDRRGSGACSEAAAAIAAAAIAAGGSATLCVNAAGDGAHVTTTVEAQTFDPYADRWVAQNLGCHGHLRLEPGWFAPAKIR